MATYRLWPATSGPGSVFNDGQPINLGTEFYVTTTAWATHLHFWRGTTAIAGTVTGAIWRVDNANAGTRLAVATFTLSGTGWQTVALATPLQLTATQRYRVTYHSPNAYVATGGYFVSGGPGASGITNGILSSPSNANAVGGNGSFIYGAATAFPTSGFNGGNYWADVTVTDVDPSSSAPVQHAASGTAAATSGSSASASARLVAAGTAAATALAFGSASALLGAAGVAAATSGSSGSADVLAGPAQIPASGTAAATSGASGSAQVRAAASGTSTAVSGAAGASTARLSASGTAAAVSGSTGSASLPVDLSAALHLTATDAPPAHTVTDAPAALLVTDVPPAHTVRSA